MKISHFANDIYGFSSEEKSFSLSLFLRNRKIYLQEWATGGSLNFLSSTEKMARAAIFDVVKKCAWAVYKVYI